MVGQQPIFLFTQVYQE